jgi:hypothetical protein
MRTAFSFLGFGMVWSDAAEEVCASASASCLVDTLVPDLGIFGVCEALDETHVASLLSVSVDKWGDFEGESSDLF